MKKSSPWLVLAIVISLIAGRFLLTSSHFHTHDDIQVFRLSEYVSCWRDGQIPCRWSANLGGGFGYPLFIFYPPMIYFFGMIINSLGFSLITSLNILAFLTFPLAAYSMYKLGYVLTKNNQLAFLASTLFTLLPYRALNVFVRGVYAENLALSLFPLALASAYALVTSKRNSLTLSLILTIILLTHNISSMFMYPLIILWLALIIIITKKYDRLKISMINLIIPFGLSAFFFFPALLEKPLVQTESMIFDYYNYIVHFISLNQIFLSDYWGYGGSNYGADSDGMSFMIGKFIWVPTLLTSLIYFIKVLKGKKIKFEPILIFSLSIALLFIFLTHPKSIFIWQNLPLIEYVQFPWRFIGVAGTFLIIALTTSLNKITKFNPLPFILILVSSSLLIYLPLFRPEHLDPYEDQDFLTGDLLYEQTHSHIYDYLPKTVHRIPEKSGEDPIHASTGIIEISAYNKSSNSLSVKAYSDFQQDITLSVFDYPGWISSVDGEVTEHIADETGLITLSVPEGDHEITLQFRETPNRQFFNILSLSTLVLVLLLSRKYRINLLS